MVPQMISNFQENSEITTPVDEEEIEKYINEVSLPFCKPHLLNREDLNNFIQDLQLTKNQSELLISRLQGCNLFQAQTKVTHFRTCRHTLSNTFV